MYRYFSVYWGIKLYCMEYYIIIMVASSTTEMKFECTDICWYLKSIEGLKYIVWNITLLSWLHPLPQRRNLNVQMFTDICSLLRDKSILYEILCYCHGCSLYHRDKILMYRYFAVYWGIKSYCMKYYIIIMVASSTHSVTGLVTGDKKMDLPRLP